MEIFFYFLNVENEIMNPERMLFTFYSFPSIESFLSPPVYTIVVSFMENGQLSESDSLEWAGDLAFLHLCILNVLKRRSVHSKILRPPGLKKKKSEFNAK